MKRRSEENNRVEENPECQHQSPPLASCVEDARDTQKYQNRRIDF